MKNKDDSSELVELQLTVLVSFREADGELEIEEVMYPSTDEVYDVLEEALQEKAGGNLEQQAPCPGFRLNKIHEPWLEEWSLDWRNKIDDELECSVCQFAGECGLGEKENVQKKQEKKTNTKSGPFEKYLG